MINIHDVNAWGYPRISNVYSREGDLYMWFYGNDDEIVSVYLYEMYVTPLDVF